MQYHYEARYAELIALLLLAAGLLATTLFWAGTEPAYMPIASGLGFFAVLRFAVDRYTHRLRLEPDALTTVSYFRRERLPYRDIRAIRYWISDRDSGRITVTLVTKDRDFDIRDSYANFTEIVDTIRQHCPQAKIQDERKFG